jgi:hypothetical protein
MSISKEFVLAGRAVFTIKCPPGLKYPHVTYKVTKVKATEQYREEAYFVSVLNGPDNTHHFMYLGKLNPFTGHVSKTYKSSLGEDSFRFRLLNRTLARIWADDHQAYEQFGFRTHHEGHCGKCGRALTVPESIETGLGPICRGK